MKNLGLVLEGGGMRGLYTSGILDVFLEKNIEFPYVIGVSMGACNGVSYISKQSGRNRTVNIDYINDRRYLSYKNFIKEKSVFGMNFIFDEIPNTLIPFDFDTYYNSPQKFIIGTTDCITGKPVYFEKSECTDMLTVVKASSSLPFIAPTVEFEGYTLLDGGISDPIPIYKAIKDGCKKNVIILTRNKGYRKKPFSMKTLSKRFYDKYEGLQQAMLNRYIIYNETLDYIEKLEAENKAFVIRPTKPLEVKRIEKNKDKLIDLYDQGVYDAKSCLNNLLQWIEND